MPPFFLESGVDLVVLAKALILGVIEGSTEFLPISSTGHLVLAGELLRFTGEKTDVFKIVIQSGAMLAIVLEYRTRFLAAPSLAERLRLWCKSPRPS